MDLDLRRFLAVVLDLNGVVARTARVHAAAWKETFDPLLRERAPEQPPFDEGEDYRRHVDGIAREDGVRGFLAARGIELPEGQPGDPAERDTVHGLARRKDVAYLRLLREGGAEPFESTVRLVRALRGRSVAVAVYSASRKCREVLRALDLEDHFDARVDGVEAARLGLAGKPAPEVPLEAARRLGVDPARAVLVEDTLAGVEAGRRGGFGLVVGIDREGGRAGELRARGADVVVRDLAELRIDGAGVERPPSALERFDEIAGRLRAAERFVLFLDYDGTLAEIAERPEDAVLPERRRALVRALAGRVPVGVVSGRDLRVVRGLVGLDELVYTGSHGFEIEGPPQSGLHLEVATDELEELDAAERALRGRLEGIPGAQVERKRFAVAAHLRRLRSAADRERVERAVRDVLAEHPSLRPGRGHEVREVRPGADWSKGHAVAWILRALAPGDGSAALYVGDDETDESVFRLESPPVTGVAVMDAPRPTAAAYSLRDPGEVERFLERLLAALEERMP